MGRDIIHQAHSGDCDVAAILCGVVGVEKERPHDALDTIPSDTSSPRNTSIWLLLIDA